MSSFIPRLLMAVIYIATIMVSPGVYREFRQRALVIKPDRATARVAPTIRRIGLQKPCIVGATLAVTWRGGLWGQALEVTRADAPLYCRVVARRLTSPQ